MLFSAQGISDLQLYSGLLSSLVFGVVVMVVGWLAVGSRRRHFQIWALWMIVNSYFLLNPMPGYEFTAFGYFKFAAIAGSVGLIALTRYPIFGKDNSWINPVTAVRMGMQFNILQAVHSELELGRSSWPNALAGFLLVLMSIPFKGNEANIIVPKQAQDWDKDSQPSAQFLLSHHWLILYSVWNQTFLLSTVPDCWINSTLHNWLPIMMVFEKNDSLANYCLYRTLALSVTLTNLASQYHAPWINMVNWIFTWDDRFNWPMDQKHELLHERQALAMGTVTLIITGIWLVRSMYLWYVSEEHTATGGTKKAA